MRTLLITRLALAAAIAAGLAACAGPQPGRQATPAAPSQGMATPASPPAASSPARSSPSPPATSPVTSPATHATSPAAPGTRPVTGWLAGKDWTVIPTTWREVALTFNAGANADAVPSILATLRHEGVPATFFLTGNFVRDFPAAARSIAAAGFRIGDHTVSHPASSPKAAG